MHDETSIQRQWQRESSFVPPYCPNPKCTHHRGGTGFWEKDGTKMLKRFPYRSQRFRCKECRRSFSYSFFFLEYQARIWGKNEAIFTAHRKGTSICETARAVGHSECMVRGRRKKMSRWGILRHAQFCENLKVKEAIVYDGLENFSFSQYDPNNINQAMGKDSFFIYDFNFAPINRKGTMKPGQKQKKRRIEKKHGRYPSDSLRESTRKVIKRLVEKSEKELTLYSDEHFQYDRAVRIDLKKKKIVHFKTSSKAIRNHHNPLYPVNYLDLQIRQENAAFRRETIAFSKNSVAMLESYFLYILYRNYMRPKFLRKKKRDPLSKLSPAQRLGLTTKILSFRELFGQRVLPTHVRLNEDWKNLYHRRDPLSRRPIQSAA
jgi:transposase-like protein